MMIHRRRFPPPRCIPQSITLCTFVMQNRTSQGKGRFSPSFCIHNLVQNCEYFQATPGENLFLILSPQGLTSNQSIGPSSHTLRPSGTPRLSSSYRDSVPGCVALQSRLTRFTCSNIMSAFYDTSCKEMKKSLKPIY